jgi:hypothetical protein
MALTKVKNSNLHDADLVALAGNDGSALTGVSVAPSSITGLTSTADELNILDGVTASTTELNYVDGVTSLIQGQLDAKQASDADLTTLATNGIGTSANQIVQLDGNAKLPAVDGSALTNLPGGGLYASVAIVEERGAGGGMTSGAWRVRDIDTEVSDSDGIVTVASSQFTLQTGVYTLEWVTTGRGIQEWSSRCQNITDSSMAGQGMSTFAVSGGTEATTSSSVSSGVVTVTLTAQKSFEIQAYSRSTNNSYGYGSDAAFYISGLSTDIHTRVVIYKHS